MCPYTCLQSGVNNADIKLEAAVPCQTQVAAWNVKNKERHDRILSLCDKITVLQEGYTADCMQKRNKYMVDSSDYIIAVWNGKPSETDKQ